MSDPFWARSHINARRALAAVASLLLLLSSACSSPTDLPAGAAGSYTFFIDTSIDGLWFNNADGSALDVDVPAP